MTPGPTDTPLVVVPTYNEVENLPDLLRRLRTSVPEAHLLVVDDASPDGTGALADRLADDDAAVAVLHRPRKDGLGAAYVAGFGWALARGFDVVVAMDADGSHQPEQLPRLLRALEGADLVLGSRYVPGGAVQDWPRRRELLSRAGNAYTRRSLGLSVRDATGGYRAYRSSTLEQLDLGSVASAGYCFQVDLVRRALAAGLRVEEVPITFVEREKGTSKMTGGIVREALIRVTGWGIEHRTRELRSRWGRRSAAGERS